MSSTTPSIHHPMMQVTKTHRGTHAVHVLNFSTLRREHCSEDGSVASPVFTVGGLDWILRYYPDGSGEEDDDEGYVGAYVELVTNGAAAWAYVALLVLDQTTGLPVPGTSVWHDDPTLFDASSQETSSWGVSNLAVRSELLQESGGRLTIECTIDVCVDRLRFADPPSAKLAAPLHMDDDDDMPRAAVDAFLHFLHTDTLLLVPGMSAAGYRDVLRHLLLAAQRYRLPRLAAICERLLCHCGLDIEQAAETLAMADRHGFEELKEACVAYVSDKHNYARVRKTQGYAKLYRVAPHLTREVCIKYTKSYGVDVVYDEQTNLPLEISGLKTQLYNLPETLSQLLPLSQIDDVTTCDSSVKFTLSYLSPDDINFKM